MTPPRLVWMVPKFPLPAEDGARVATAMRLMKTDVPIILFSVQWSLPETAHTIADAVLGKGQHPTGLLNQLEQLLRTRHAQSA